jgi:hypothetical protein
LVTYGVADVTDDDRIFKALADPTRRFLLDRLFARDGRTLTELESELEMTRFGAMKHLRVLEDAGLVVTRRQTTEAPLSQPGADPPDPRPVDRQVQGAPGLGAHRPQDSIGGERDHRTATTTQVYQFSSRPPRAGVGRSRGPSSSRYFFASRVEIANGRRLARSQRRALG